MPRPVVLIMGYSPACRLIPEMRTDDPLPTATPQRAPAPYPRIAQRGWVRRRAAISGWRMANGEWPMANGRCNHSPLTIRHSPFALGSADQRYAGPAA